VRASGSVDIIRKGDMRAKPGTEASCEEVLKDTIDAWYTALKTA
jgi:hypothetical protein